MAPAASQTRWMPATRQYPAPHPPLARLLAALRPHRGLKYLFWAALLSLTHTAHDGE